MSSNLFSDYVLPFILAIIMFGVGSSLEVKDFKRIIKHPKPILTGLAGQMLLLPALAFLIAAISPLPSLIKAGLILIAACPGGTASNLLTYLLKGKVALSVSLTAVNSFLILFTVPLLVSLGLQVFAGEQTELNFPLGNTILKIFLTTLLPVCLGILFRRKYPQKTKRLQKIFRWLLPGLLAAAFAGVLFLDKGKQHVSWQEFIESFPYALALNISAMLAAFFLTRTVLSQPKSWYTISSIEVGLQNSGLALFVASTLLNYKEMAVVAVVYGSFSFFSTGLLGWVLKELSPVKERATAGGSKATY